MLILKGNQQLKLKLNIKISINYVINGKQRPWVC